MPSALWSKFCISASLKPFRVGVHFDEMEVCTTVNAANTCEYDQPPAGTVGFKLVYWQNSC